ncbi:MAG: Hsp70 family protein [Phycisphaerales bacterium]|nr:MAG: Hsp70 family protein [Phycisphaerales bacterium]
MMSCKRYIGIDLGTTYSVVARVDRGGHIGCVPNREGESLTPSVVAVDEEGRLVAGKEAVDVLQTDPGRAAEAFKRHMGEADYVVRLGGREYTPVALSACLLKRLVEDAQHAVGDVDGAVITVPAHFGDRQRSATLDAAARAGINVVAIINEPTAAALANAFEQYVSAGGDPSDLEKATIASTAPGISVVCDLGGGTFDLTVIRINGSDFDVLATGGSLQLGGRDWDDRIVDEMERHLLSTGGPDPHHDPAARARMRMAAQAAKHVLTVKPQAAVQPPYPGSPPCTLTRERFEHLSEGLLWRLRECTAAVMSDAVLAWSDVHDLMLVGGATRMPMVRRLVQQISGLVPNTRLQPDLTVAQGAAVFAAIHSVHEAMAPAGRRTAAAGRAASAPAAGDDNGEAEMDALVDDVIDSAGHSLEALARGSGQGGFDEAFAAAAGSVRLRDVNSHSLGVMVRSPRYDKKVNTILIPRNTPLPAECRRVFATRVDNQSRIRIPVLEGEVRELDACTQIGTCTIEALPSNLPKGSPVSVTLRYDANGTVRVRAEEMSTQTAAEAVIDRSATVIDQRATEGGNGKPHDRVDELAAALAQLGGG